MKKKFLYLALLGITAFTVSACSDFVDMFYYGENPLNNSENPGGGGYQSISTPPPGSTEANRASVTYKDYINNNSYPLSSSPSIGRTNLLVIPVWFNDSYNYISTAKRDDVRSDIEKAYFGSNANGELGLGSVKSYYEEESHGALTLTGKVSGWYDCGYSVSRYSRDDTVEKTSKLVQDAIEWYFTNNPSEKKTDYDCDKDGFLDGVMLIYAGPDYQTLGKETNKDYANLWAYCYWIQTIKPNKTNPTPNAFFWASYDFMYDKETAMSKTGYRYHNGDTRYSSVDAHTFIHEMGHMFGLEDYYDYSSYNYRPAGGFSMQDHTVGGHDPFSSFALGWGKAYVPNQTTTINLKPFSTTGEMIVLTPEWNTFNSPFDEYLILEYYTPTGLNQFDVEHLYMNNTNSPAGSSSPGIRLWHVDARLVCPTGYNSGLGDYTYNDAPITTNPNQISTYGVTMLMSNTYDDGQVSTSYLSPLGRNYYNYNLLQLIRNNTGETYYTKTNFNASNLFGYGSRFKLDSYKNQFVNSNKLNNGKSLGYTFEVNGLTEEYASITVTKQ